LNEKDEKLLKLENKLEETLETSPQLSHPSQPHFPETATYTAPTSVPTSTPTTKATILPTIEETTELTDLTMDEEVARESLRLDRVFHKVGSMPRHFSNPTVAMGGAAGYGGPIESPKSKPVANKYLSSVQITKQPITKVVTTNTVCDISSEEISQWKLQQIEKEKEDQQKQQQQERQQSGVVVEPSTVPGISDELTSIEKEELRLYKALNSHRETQTRSLSTKQKVTLHKDTNLELEKWNITKNAILAGNLSEFAYSAKLLKDANNFTDDEGNTLLHFCVAMHDQEMCKYLVHLGAKLIKNKLGKSPLDMALVHEQDNPSYKDIVEILSPLR